MRVNPTPVSDSYSLGYHPWSTHKEFSLLQLCLITHNPIGKFEVTRIFQPRPAIFFLLMQKNKTFL